MKIQLWRNATIELEIGGSVFLIDPMLGKKGSLGVFPWTDDKRLNPLVDLPFSSEITVEKLQKIDAVFVTHLHPDHWDQTAIEAIDKDKPILCPSSIASQIKSYGFRKVQSIESNRHFNGIEIFLTEGRHGMGKIEEKMGKVNGVVFKKHDESIYIAGDSIWCNELQLELEKHTPQHVVVAGGAATFSIGEPVTMDTSDIYHLASYAPDVKIWITHLESISTCKQDRNEVNNFLEEKKILFQCKVLEDGQAVELKPSE